MATLDVRPGPLPGRPYNGGHSGDRDEGAMSAGEAAVRQAVKWIDDRLRDHPQTDRPALVDEASRRFDLSPIEADFLYRHLASKTSVAPQPPRSGGASP